MTKSQKTRHMLKSPDVNFIDEFVQNLNLPVARIDSQELLPKLDKGLGWLDSLPHNKKYLIMAPFKPPGWSRV